MNEENFGPLMNEDGSPSEFTKQMFNINSDRELMDRYANRMEQLRSAIASDFAKDRWISDPYRGATLQATFECVKEMLDLHSKMLKLETQMFTEIKNQHCNADCGCAGGQKKEECTFIPSCEKCWTNGK